MSESIIQMFLELQQLSATAHVLGNLLQCPTTQHERNLKLIKTLICRKVPISTVFSSKCQEKSVFLKFSSGNQSFHLILIFSSNLQQRTVLNIYIIYMHIYIYIVCVYIYVALIQRVTTRKLSFDTSLYSENSDFSLPVWKEVSENNKLLLLRSFSLTAKPCWSWG